MCVLYLALALFFLWELRRVQLDLDECESALVSWALCQKRAPEDKRWSVGAWVAGGFWPPTDQRREVRYWTQAAQHAPARAPDGVAGDQTVGWPDEDRKLQKKRKGTAPLEAMDMRNCLGMRLTCHTTIPHAPLRCMRPGSDLACTIFPPINVTESCCVVTPPVPARCS